MRRLRLRTSQMYPNWILLLFLALSLVIHFTHAFPTTTALPSELISTNTISGSELDDSQTTVFESITEAPDESNDNLLASQFLSENRADNQLAFDDEETTTAASSRSINSAIELVSNVIASIDQSTTIPSEIIETTIITTTTEADQQQDQGAVENLEGQQRQQLHDNAETTEESTTMKEPAAVDTVFKAEIFNELHTIWSYTKSLNDSDDSNLKSTLTSLVHFTYDKVAQIEPGETLGRLKHLLRELRDRLIPSEELGQQENSNRHKRSVNPTSNNSNGNSEEELATTEKERPKSLADDIQEIESFLSLPPFSFTQNEIDYNSNNINDFDDQFGPFDNYNKATIKPNTDPKLNVLPSDTIIQKVIHVFPTSQSPMNSQPQKIVQSITTTTTKPAATKVPIISSSGLIQQSSITVNNVTGAIIPLNAEQIANAIIKLLYQNYNSSSSLSSNFPQKSPIDFDSSYPSSTSSLIDSVFDEAYGFGQQPAEENQHADSLQSLSTDNNTFIVSTIASEFSTTTSTTIAPSLETTAVPGNTITPIIVELLPVISETVETQTPPVNGINETAITVPQFSLPSTEFPSLAQILTAVTRNPILLSTKKPQSQLVSSLTLEDVINRIILNPSSNTQKPDSLFGIAGPGNRRTTTSTIRPIKYPSSSSYNKYNTSSSSVEDDQTNEEDDDNDLQDQQYGILNLMQNLTTSNLMKTPLTLLNGTKEGLNEVVQTFNVLNFQAKMTLIFALSISTLSIILGVFSLGPPIIIVGVLGIIIPIALLLFLTRQEKKANRNGIPSSSNGSGQNVVLGLGIDSIINNAPINMQDVNFILKLINDAINKYKL